MNNGVLYFVEFIIRKLLVAYSENKALSLTQFEVVDNAVLERLVSAQIVMRMTSELQSA